MRNNLLKHFFVILFGLFMIYPLLWLVSASFKQENEIFQGLRFLPENPTLGNYINGWKGVSGVSFGRFFLNSSFIAVSCIIGNNLSCSMAAFAFAKLEFKLKPILFSVMMVTLMLPFHVRLIPQYIVFNKLGLVNTYYPMILPRFFAVEGFFVFMLVQFIRNISNQLLEAARIDGCGTFRIYTGFIMPLSMPALVTSYSDESCRVFRSYPATSTLHAVSWTESTQLAGIAQAPDCSCSPLSARMDIPDSEILIA